MAIQHDHQLIHSELRRALEQFSEDSADEVGFSVYSDGSIHADLYSDDGDIIRSYPLSVEVI